MNGRSSAIDLAPLARSSPRPRVGFLCARLALIFSPFRPAAFYPLLASAQSSSSSFQAGPASVLGTNSSGSAVSIVRRSLGVGGRVSGRYPSGRRRLARAGEKRAGSVPAEAGIGRRLDPGPRVRALRGPRINSGRGRETPKLAAENEFGFRSPRSPSETAGRCGSSRHRRDTSPSRPICGCGFASDRPAAAPPARSAS
jgi:hypothetical protein